MKAPTSVVDENELEHGGDGGGHGGHGGGGGGHGGHGGGGGGHGGGDHDHDDDDHGHGGHGHGGHDHDGHGHGGHGHGGHGHGDGGGHDHDPPRTDPTSIAIPRLERVNYFYGQMLGVREFRAEQTYFREKLKLHNRYLHGSGVVCGLAVRPCPTDPEPCDPQAPPPCVVVEPGLALDCSGNEIVLREPRTVLLADHLSVEWRRRLAAEGGTLWLSIGYREIGVQPTRPLAVDDCSASPLDCVHAMVREDICVRVTPERPAARKSCSACCDPCCDGALLLARVRVTPGRRVGEHDIDNTIRSPLSPFDSARIDRIGWTHGAQYTREEASALLSRGLYFHFSRPVHAATVTAPGVFDLWAIEGGRGRRGLIYHIDTRGESEPGAEMVRWVRFQNLTDEVLQPGDRVLAILRSGFILDDCCRSLDGDHAGGLPIDRDYHQWDRSSEVPPPPCRQPPPRQLMPWMSGNGDPAGNFESWFYIEADQGHAQGGNPRRGQP